MLWVESYRPKRIAECILPEELKTTFQNYVDAKFVPHLLLSGTSGVGKTTVAKAMLDELGCDSIMINGSLNAGIDILRTNILNYASSVSMASLGRKYIIIDEADNLKADIQAALRGFIEEFSNNCGFILTCNTKNKIIPALQSRCAGIDFKIRRDDKAYMAKEFLGRLCVILDAENVTYEKRVLSELIMKFFPDWRRVIHELQRYSAGGVIDLGILGKIVDTDIRDLVASLRSKDFVAMRKWVALNASDDIQIIFRRLYDTAYDHMKPESVPNLVMILADYQYKAAFVVDHEINMAACMTQIMVDCEFR